MARLKSKLTHATPLPCSIPSSAMRKASVNSLAFSFSRIWHFIFVSSGRHFSMTLISNTLFFIFLASFCFSRSLQVGHLEFVPRHRRHNEWPHDIVTGSHMRNMQIGHSRRSMVVCYVTPTIPSRKSRQNAFPQVKSLCSQDSVTCNIL